MSEISLFICSAQTFPCIFWTIICLVRICHDDSFLMSLHSVSFTTNSCPFYNRFVQTHLYYFKGFFYCLLHGKSIAALTPLFFGGFLAHVCRPQGPLCLHNPDSARTGFCITIATACVQGLLVSFAIVTRIIKNLQLAGSVANIPRSGRPRKLSVEAKAFIDQQMRSNDVMTSAQIQKKLAKHGVAVSLSTVQRSRKQLDSSAGLFSRLLTVSCLDLPRFFSAFYLDSWKRPSSCYNPARHHSLSRSANFTRYYPA